MAEITKLCRFPFLEGPRRYFPVTDVALFTGLVRHGSMHILLFKGALHLFMALQTWLGSKPLSCGFRLDGVSQKNNAEDKKTDKDS